ncbi:MAG TPA: HD domain-containing protein [Candidatus Limnocylindria bacterium]|nr:HD domain-containing protein [Candidatus Limnocylindria bacterium]
MRERVQQTVRFVVAQEGDARHAERTAAVLRELGADEELILAGLLHDRGKPAQTRLWHRITGVLLGRLAPRVRDRIARGESTLARYLDHARRGAAQAEIEGRPARVVRLIARHHEPPRDADERLLARADREALP